MKILVTGGAGFIGSNFIYYYQKQYPDVEIVCLDALTYAAGERTLDAAKLNQRFSFIQGDIADRALVYSVFEQHRFDFVVNFAAESHVDNSILYPDVFVKTNVMGTQVLLDACVRFGKIRFHQVSTDEVYGHLPLDQPDLFFTEDSPIVPSSPYSASKASADFFVLAYYKTFGLPVTVTRCSNNYGAFQFIEKFIPRVLVRALNDIPVPVYGTGLNIRDWLYVEDHCSAIDTVVRNGRLGEVYCVGGHNEKQNIDVVKIILAQLNKPESLIDYVADRPGHDLRYGIDPVKISNELGWEPATRFEDGIRLTIDWYLENKHWWEKMGVV